MHTTFADLNALAEYIREIENGYTLVDYRLLQGYEGMVLGIGIFFDIRKENYKLRLEWISFGLDLYAENLLEGYSYKFETLETLLAYLQSEYDINITDIPIRYKVDNSKFPNPLTDAAKKVDFEIAWKRFKNDFRQNKFLDSSLQLVYTTPPFAE